MIFNKHYDLEGTHAPFSASKSSWLRYDDEKLIEVYTNMQAKELGTKLHEFAKMAIDLGIKQPRSNNTLSAYINDAIGFAMDTEVVLFYSKYFYGTADSIAFRKNFLRIHDLKTGSIPAHMEQLVVYAALFCLEYKVDPKDIKIELRLYQNNEVLVHQPEPEEIKEVISKICHCNSILLKMEERGA